MAWVASVTSVELEDPAETVEETGVSVESPGTVPLVNATGKASPEAPAEEAAAEELAEAPAEASPKDPPEPLSEEAEDGTAVVEASADCSPEEVED